MKSNTPAGAFPHLTNLFHCSGLQAPRGLSFRSSSAKLCSLCPRAATTLSVKPCFLASLLKNLVLSREGSVAASTQRLWPIAPVGRSALIVSANSGREGQRQWR